MAIPKYNELYDIVLKELSDSKEYRTRDVKSSISNKLNLTEEEKKELLPSKSTTVINSRIGWAITYLKKAELLESKKRGFINITKLGLKMYQDYPHITEELLLKSPSFLNWIESSNAKSIKKSVISNYTSNMSTPEESMENAYSRINDELSGLILENILNNNPIFFEKLVIDLLLKMGYGEFRPDAGRTTSPTNDGGIDGIINEDRLGIDKIAIQAKRYDKSNKVGTPLLQNFVGALVGKGLSKGVFITTSSFTSGAIDYAKNQSIILIDGEKLADLMIEYNVGTFTSHTYEIKRIDSDYFNISD